MEKDDCSAATSSVAVTKQVVVCVVAENVTSEADSTTSYVQKYTMYDLEQSVCASDDSTSPLLPDLPGNRIRIC
jgi:hypothetical protein